MDNSSHLVNPPEGPPVHRARMPVSVELLHEILKLPRETSIVGATLDPAGHYLEFVIEDPRLAPVHEGQEIPQNMPKYVSYGTLHGTLIQAIWKFDQEEVTTGDTLPDDLGAEGDDEDEYLGGPGFEYDGDNV